MTRTWRGASFSLKFATVILVAGATVAVVPFLLAESNNREQAEKSAADKVGIAVNLIAGQRTSLDAFIAGVARQIDAGRDLTNRAAIQTTLIADSQVLGTDDVIGVAQPDGSVVAVQGTAVLSGADPRIATLVDAYERGAHTAAASDGSAWLVGASTLSGAGATAFVARPVTASFIDAIDENVTTAADPVDLLLLRDGRYALDGAVGGSRVSAGDPAGATRSVRPGVRRRLW